MCLMLVATGAPSGREELNRAAHNAAATGLRVELDPASVALGSQQTVRAHISEEGGCACSLLSDDADWKIIGNWDETRLSRTGFAPGAESDAHNAAEMRFWFFG